MKSPIELPKMTQGESLDIIIKYEETDWEPNNLEECALLLAAYWPLRNSTGTIQRLCINLCDILYGGENE